MFSQDITTRLILFFGLAAIFAIWTFTTPKAFLHFLQTLPKPPTLVSLGSETLLLLQLLTPNILSFPQSSFDLFFSIIGLIIFCCGIGLAVWAKLTMKMSWGSPAQHDISKQKRLITSGPFNFSRNPIYLGLLLTFIGFEISLRSVLVILAIPLFYFIKRAIVIEEKLLKIHFGNTYEVYSSRVPRFFKLF